MTTPITAKRLAQLLKDSGATALKAPEIHDDAKILALVANLVGDDRARRIPLERWERAWDIIDRETMG
jgi:hypothetical protein